MKKPSDYPGWTFGTKEAEYFQEREQAEAYMKDIDGVLTWCDYRGSIFCGVRPKTFEEYK